MYQTSVPIAVESIRDNFIDEDLKKYLNSFKKGNINRVFVCLLNDVCTEESSSLIMSEKFKKTIDFFKENGLEVGIWLGGFGHGSNLVHSNDKNGKRNYQKLTGVLGESFNHGYCPLDENFTTDYIAIIRILASYNPDLIMLDDDFRLNLRSYYLGCFCDKHLEKFQRTIGENITREEIEKRIFSGGTNKYRDAYLDIQKETLLEFAQKVRQATDEINPKIRIGACMVYSTWDFEGTDGIEIAKNFAASTKPFTRGIGAPYHSNHTVIEAIENERLQAFWIKNNAPDIEFFTEGDVYPRPRYNVPSKVLELFDLALYCSGETDGILKYIFDYTMNVTYETGYIDRHIFNHEICEAVKNIFHNKKPTGIVPFGAIHKFRNFDFSKISENKIGRKIPYAFNTHTAQILSKNGISTCYGKSDYPIAAFGENAKYLSVDKLKNGVILDSRGAEILQSRGVDTGLLSNEGSCSATGEFFAREKDTVLGINDFTVSKIICNKKANILSRILPDNSPGSYTYENDDGIRFLVFAGDFQFINLETASSVNYCNNYYRQKQIIDSVEFLCGKKLPATCPKNPNLYILSAKNEKSTSILMLNVFADDILFPKVTLDKEYSKINFAVGNGKLCGDTVNLDTIPSYGVAAFEVS